MKIRNKILLYFSFTVTVVSAISLSIIYILFSEFREEEFQQQQNDKIKYTIGLVVEFKQMSEELALLMDEQDIHDFYDEKLLIFNGQKELIFSSLDSLPIRSTNRILNELSPSTRWIEMKEGSYDLLGVYAENKGKKYYAISKAYDAVGYSKMYFLRNVLIGIFIAISVIVALISLYLSNIISKPITRLAENLSHYDLSSKRNNALKADYSSFELQHLTERFNELLKRTNEAFAFQKNATQHISHELKTPMAILVSELERAQGLQDPEEIKNLVSRQIDAAKSLGEIINVFLEISKMETGAETDKVQVRIDEVLFDQIEKLKIIHPQFDFELNYFPDEFEEDKLLITANKMLVKQAFQNLLMNCVVYSSNQKAKITIDCSSDEELLISIYNEGKNVAVNEIEHLFKHSFRGKNSKGKVGFGLGLVLTQKIMDFHSGGIRYESPAKNQNIFHLHFPLATTA